MAQNACRGYDVGVKIIALVIGKFQLLCTRWNPTFEDWNRVSASSSYKKRQAMHAEVMALCGSTKYTYAPREGIGNSWEEGGSKDPKI